MAKTNIAPEKITMRFTNHTTDSLIVLGNQLKGTLNNPKCAAIVEPVTNTLQEIKAELKRRVFVNR